MIRGELKKIPAVDTLLKNTDIKSLVDKLGNELVKYSIRIVLEDVRLNIHKNQKAPPQQVIIDKILNNADLIHKKSLKQVINATGIILHTNLGRAPLGKYFLEEISPIILGYSNIEFNLLNGKRGKRTEHVIENIKFVTGAEDALVVNNNAAAISLILRVLVEDREVIISRGELIEIGDSFRLPEIMEASGVKIVEVGTTNRTKFTDYENAITSNTGMILKAHKSNYYLSGFIEDVSIKELSRLATRSNLLLVYDIGSGLLNKHNKLPAEEPNVKDSIESGADLVTFSCDKLLAGPQAGIVVGKKNIISELSKAPLMRTYRVDKITLGLLDSALRIHLEDEELLHRMPLYDMLNRSQNELKKIAEKLSQKLNELNIKNNIKMSKGYCGGGTLPNYEISSYTVELLNLKNDKKFAQKIYASLLKLDRPVIGILRKGKIHFDVLTLYEEEIPFVVNGIKEVL